MVELIVVLVLLIVGYSSGRFLERRHFESIERRERELMRLVTTSSKRPIGKIPAPQRIELVQGACVVSVDYFKRFVAGLRQFFGGNVSSYESLLDRARREAILRLKESCRDASQVVNLRIETSSISKGRRDQVGSIEVHAYATAIYL